MSTGRLHCEAFLHGRCRSCSWIERDYAAQLAAKQQHCQQLLAGCGPIDWLPPQPSQLAGFRNKAKLVVGGDVAHPTLGILDADQRGIDLVDCPLYPAELACAFEPLREFIIAARIAPYDVSARRGELKYLLLTVAPGGQLMLRFVLRSREALGRIERQLPELRARLPQLRVVSVNLQPQHAAVIEGEQELLLGAQEALPMAVNGFSLYLQPGGFFQTNTEIAAALYRQARDWCRELPAASALDLYCGVGGFALHLAAPGREVHGIEISPAAIASARRSAREAGLDIRFDCGDATVPGVDAELWVVNPPRRGLGPALCARIEASRARWLLYSSCNPDSLARDLAALPGFDVLRARLFDMFPHTGHSEVLLMLQRNNV